MFYHQVNYFNAMVEINVINYSTSSTLYSHRDHYTFSDFALLMVVHLLGNIINLLAGHVDKNLCQPLPHLQDLENYTRWKE